MEAHKVQLQHVSKLLVNRPTTSNVGFADTVLAQFDNS